MPTLPFAEALPSVIPVPLSSPPLVIPAKAGIQTRHCEEAEGQRGNLITLSLRTRLPTGICLPDQSSSTSIGFNLLQ